MSWGAWFINIPNRIKTFFNRPSTTVLPTPSEVHPNLDTDLRGPSAEPLVSTQSVATDRIQFSPQVLYEKVGYSAELCNEGACAPIFPARFALKRENFGDNEQKYKSLTQRCTELDDGVERLRVTPSRFGNSFYKNNAIMLHGRSNGEKRTGYYNASNVAVSGLNTAIACQYPIVPPCRSEQLEVNISYFFQMLFEYNIDCVLT